MKTILLAPNSFKECSDSVTITDILFKDLSAGLRADYILNPISDGGDGFIDVCKYNFKGNALKYEITTAYGDTKTEVNIFYDDKDSTVFIESANVLGLKVVPVKKRNPLKLSSKGLGELLRKISDDKINGRLNVKKVILGIGGTATIDAGFGACSVLGLHAFDGNGNEIELIPKNFIKVKKLVWDNPKLPFEIYCILDVDNPLIGGNNGIKVYGKQKNASDEDIKLIEDGVLQVLQILENNGWNIARKNLSGAGGGIPSGLKLFLNSKNIFAGEFILNNLKLKKSLQKADILITGEGSFDEQTLMGKGAGILVNEAVKIDTKIFAICGKAEEQTKNKLKNKVEFIELIDFFSSVEESIKNYKTGLQKASEIIANKLK